MIIDFLREYGFALWLGISMAVIGFSFKTWQYWFVMVPTILLSAWR